MIESAHHADYDKFFVDSRAAGWGSYLPVDPILTPISNMVVASALCIEEDDVQLLAEDGLLFQTCVIEIIGQENTFCCNYWDVMQASACFSLIVVGVNREQALDFSEILCDRVAHLSEDATDEDGVDLQTLMPIILESLAPFRNDIKQPTLEYGLCSIAIKVGIDLINTNARLVSSLFAYTNQFPYKCSIVMDLEGQSRAYSTYTS